jgi:type I restriction enzyme S subunit
MKSNYKKIGDHIQLVDERNNGLKVKQLLGLSISKQFIPSVANIIGTDMENYKIIRKNQFACSTMQVRRDKKMPVALLRDVEEAIISQAYPIFQVKDEKELLPEYLMMWFTRSEFDREACFNAVGGVRGSLEWEDFCEMQLPIPSITKQREIVKEYNVIQNRIALNQQLIQKLEETAHAIYKQWFVEFEFPDESGKPYKSNGGEMVWNEELQKEIPNVWEKCILKDITNCLDFKRKPLSEEERNEFRGPFPYYGAMGIVDYVKEFIYNGEYLLFSEDGVNVIDAKGHPSVFLVWGKFWVNNHAHILEGAGNYSTRYIYLMLREANVSHLVTGAAQPKINQENMNNIIAIKPKTEIVEYFDKIVNPIFENCKIRIEQNQKLFELKDVLLSKLATIKN